MKIDYEEHYDRAYWTREKTYRDAQGRTQVYTGPSLEWDGFQMICDSLVPLVPGKSVLDIGCSGGDLTRRLMARGFTDAYGVEISKYAIEHCRPEMKGRIALADITTCPDMLLDHHGLTDTEHAARGTGAVFPQTYDLVMATDLLEHIYETDLDATFDWMVGKTNRWLFFLVATAQHPASPLSAADKMEFVHTKGAVVPPEFEGTAIAGHVNVRHWRYWVKFFAKKGLTIRWDLMYLFQMQREMNIPWQKTLGWNMQCTYILEKKS